MAVTPLARARRPGVPRLRRRYLIATAAIAILLAFSGYVAALALANSLLMVRTPLARADVIVVLGGDGPPRAAKAADLYRAGLAGAVLISGGGDCDGIRDIMASKGVPMGVMTLECESRTTWENATLSAPILAGRHIRRAILVTSWFHTRRALACMRAAAPNIEWMSSPANRTQPLWDGTEGVWIAKEYVKLAWYALVHGIDVAAPDQGHPAGHGLLSLTEKLGPSVPSLSKDVVLRWNGH